MKVRDILNPCSVFTTVYALYLVLKAYEASAITGALLWIITIISFFYYLKVVIYHRQPKLLLCLSTLIAMFGIYGFIYICFGDTIRGFDGVPLEKVNYLKNIAASLLPVYPFYIFTKKGLLTPKLIRFWIPVFIVIAIYSFSQYYMVLRTRAIQNGAFKHVEFTNNYGYMFVSILPLLFIRNPKLIFQYICIGVCVVFVVQGVKRGAILITGLSIAYYIYCSINSSRGKQRMRFILITAAAILCASYFIVDFIEHSNYFALRVRNTIAGDSSGRDVIYYLIWKAFAESNLLQMLIGHGADSSVEFSGLLAHNDWLELLSNQGVLGVTLYAVYFCVMFSTWRKHHTDPQIGISLGILFIVLFLRTLFSMSYTEYTLPLCMAYGYCMGYLSNQNTTTPRGRRIAA